jgi:hypothetical protein
MRGYFGFFSLSDKSVSMTTGSSMINASDSSSLAELICTSLKFLSEDIF